MTPNGEIHPVCGSARSPITGLISPLEPFGIQNIDSDGNYSNKCLNGLVTFTDGNGIDHGDFGYASIVSKLNAIVQNVNKLGSICFANGNGLKAQVNLRLLPKYHKHHWFLILLYNIAKISGFVKIARKYKSLESVTREIEKVFD